MENVFHFPSGKRSKAPDMESGHLQRAEALRLARSTTKFLSAADRERAAGNMDRILGELRQSHDLARAAVARAAGLGGNGDTDSSKRLDTYTLPADATDARKNRLASKATRYFDLAGAIAKLSGMPEELLLCRIFEGCSFGVAAEKIPDWEEERWSVLARMLTEMSRAVIHDTDQRGYWKTVSTMQFPYDFETRCFGADRSCFDRFSVEVGLPNTHVCRDEAPPTPSIPLARRLMAEPQTVVLVLEDGRSVSATLDFHLEIHLALGPIHGPTEIGPMLELRTEIEVVLPDCKSRLRVNSLYPAGALRLKTMLDGEWVTIVDVTGYDEPEPEGRKGAEHCYFGYFEISPALLRKYLTDEDFPLEPAHVITTDDQLSLRFEWGSVGASLEHDLLDGSLERDLAEVCRKMHADLKEFQAQRRSDSLRAEVEAFNRWRRPTNTQGKNA